MNKLILLAAMAIVLPACEPSEFRVPAIAPVPGWSGGNSAPAPAPARPAATARPIAPGAHRIDNPDERTETLAEEVWARDDAEAQRRCQNMANNYGNRLDLVERVTTRPSRNGTYRYRCWMTRSTGEIYYDDRRPHDR